MKRLTLLTRVNSYSTSVAVEPKFFPNFRVYTFGLAEHGALGLKKPGRDTIFRKTWLKPIRHFFAEENEVTDVACGYGFTAFVVKTKESNIKVYGCGLATEGQIGTHSHSVITSPLPIDIGIKNIDTKVIGLDAGRAHLAVLTDKEGIFLVGSNSYGQSAKVSIPDLENVYCGQDHTLLLTRSGKVYSFGWSTDGQTGTGVEAKVLEPKLVEGDIKSETIIKISSRCDTTLALNDKGEVFGWGSNEYMQLFDKNNLQVETPRKLVMPGKIKDIAAGGSFCMALTEDGEVFVWGYGILGAGPKVEKSFKPLRIPRTLFGFNQFQPNTYVCAIFCGLGHLAAINNHRHVYMWGKNRHGCLGIGHSNDQFFPFKVGLSALAFKVSCGVDHTMVLCKPFQ